MRVGTAAGALSGAPAGRPPTFTTTFRAGSCCHWQTEPVHVFEQHSEPAAHVVPVPLQVGHPALPASHSGHGWTAGQVHDPPAAWNVGPPVGVMATNPTSKSGLAPEKATPIVAVRYLPPPYAIAVAADVVEAAGPPTIV